MPKLRWVTITLCILELCEFARGRCGVHGLRSLSVVQNFTQLAQHSRTRMCGFDLSGSFFPPRRTCFQTFHRCTRSRPSPLPPNSKNGNPKKTNDVFARSRANESNSSTFWWFVILYTFIIIIAFFLSTFEPEKILCSMHSTKKYHRIIPSARKEGSPGSPTLPAKRERGNSSLHKSSAPKTGTQPAVFCFRVDELEICFKTFEIFEFGYSHVSKSYRLPARGSGRNVGSRPRYRLLNCKSFSNT